MSKGKDKASKQGELLVCRNPKAQHDFELEEKLEAGIVLTGSEVKSLRARRADIESSYATVDGMELFLHNMHIAPYEQAGPFGHEPKRSRKLLAHREEILKLLGKLAHRGYTLVPLSVYFKNGRAKVELALGKGKKRADRREDIKRDIDLREAREAIGRGRRQ
jgi:SsrA-binding protein